MQCVDNARRKSILVEVVKGFYVIGYGVHVHFSVTRRVEGNFEPAKECKELEVEVLYFDLVVVRLTKRVRMDGLGF